MSDEPAPPAPPAPSEAPVPPARPAPRAARVQMSLVRVSVFLVLGSLAGITLGGWPLLGQLRDLQARQIELTRHNSATIGELEALRRQHDTLAQEQAQLTTDRDNLLAQTRRVFDERSQAEAERDLLASTFQQVAGERLALLGLLRPLEEQVAELQRSQATLGAEREQLEQQLAKAKGRSQEKSLRIRLTQMARKEQELNASLRDAQRQAKATARQKDLTGRKLDRLSKRLEQLQQEYTEQVSENAMLRRQMDRLPKDVTGIAREHERLVKELTDTHYNMGVLFTKRRDYVRAEKEFLKAIELRPDDAASQYNLGVIYAEHRPDRERALAYFRQFLALKPGGYEANWAKQYIATWQAWEAKERLE